MDFWEAKRHPLAQLLDLCNVLPSILRKSLCKAGNAKQGGSLQAYNHCTVEKIGRLDTYADEL